MPVGDDAIAGGDMGCALAHEEGTDENGEEDEVGGEDGKNRHAIANELFARPVAARVVGIPVFIASTTTGRSAVEWRLTAEAWIFAFGLDRVASEGGGHWGSEPSSKSLYRFA